MTNRIRILVAALLALALLAPAASAAPQPDAAPQAHGKPATLLPGCPHATGLRHRSYVEGLDGHGRVICASVQRKRIACKAGYHRKTVRVKKRIRRHHRWIVVRHHHRIVWVKRSRCVQVKHHAPKTSPASSPTLTAPTAAPSVIRAGIDPTYTQDPSNNLIVTWDYSASSTVSPLPDGTLSLTVQEPNKTGSSGGCTMNVGGTITGGTCTQELPHYGQWNVTVTYTGASTTVAPASQTETEDIEPLPVPPPPTPAPVTITKAWGTDAPSSQPAISALVIGTTASIQVTDANYEGATSVTISDQNGDSCTATINATKATCSMTVGATPTRFEVAYPGGTPTSSTDPTTQQVTTTTWPAQTVSIPNPDVTVQQATVQECGGYQQGGPAWAPPGSPVGCGSDPGNGLASGQWPNPITVTTGERVELNASAIGSLTSDRTPQGSISYTVTGPAAPTFVYDQQTGASDCSASENSGGQAVGACLYTFGTPGTYTVTVGFTSGTPDYADVPDALTETINVQ